MLLLILQIKVISKEALGSLKAQKRGGKGKTGISTREDDFVVQIFTANTHTPVLFFSTQGLVYKIKAHKIQKEQLLQRKVHIQYFYP